MTRRSGRVKRDERIKAPKPRDYDFLGSLELIEHEHDWSWRCRAKSIRMEKDKAV